MTDYKQLCTELLSELENAIGVIYGEDGTRHISSADAVITKADAALAEPEPEVPTTQELKTFACEWWKKFGFVKDKATCCWVLDEVDPDHFADFARAVLARWGNRQELLDNLPADDEVAELMEWLNKAAKHAASVGWDYDSCKLARSASLIERLSHPQPVPVSECLPEPEPVAWMYQGEPSFDGTDWQETWEVTTDKRLAEFKATPDQPIPLFSIQPQRQ